MTVNVYVESTPKTSVSEADSTATMSTVVLGAAVSVKMIDDAVHVPARSSTSTPVESPQPAIKINASADVVRCLSFIGLSPFGL